MSNTNMHLVSTVILKKEEITHYFYNYCKLMAVPLHLLGYILDVPLNKIVKGTVWEFEVANGDACVTLGPRVYPAKKWNATLAEFLSVAALEKDPFGEGFAGATHNFLKAHNANPNLKIKMSMMFTATGARLTLLLDVDQ